MKQLLFVLFLLCVTNLVDPARIDCSTDNVASALAKFSSSLYQVASKSVGEFDNVVVSPSSIANVLAMTMVGARGSTADQMKRVLQLANQDDASILCSFGALDPAKSGDASFTSVNRLLVSNDFPLLPIYRSALMDHFGAAAENVNFSLPTLTQTINQQVEKLTRRRIKNLIPQGFAQPSTKVLLLNAVHFKGSWAKAFNPAKNRIEPFYVSPRHDLIPTMMMVTRGRFRAAFVRELDAWALELPYSGSDIKMLILLPNDYRGLSRLESALSSKIINSIDDRLRNTLMNVIIPKFKFEAATDLKQVLQRLGVTRVFVDDADLSGISGSKGLYVSDALHRAFIEVNEKGTEAAAATVFKLKARSFRPPSAARTFLADHPFLFVIRNHRTKMILFMGRLAKP